MRYEAKHSYFKDLAQKIKNFKNISKSLAERHQRLVCYQFLGSQSLVKELATGKGNTVYILNAHTLHTYIYIHICTYTYVHRCVHTHTLYAHVHTQTTDTMQPYTHMQKH